MLSAFDFVVCDEQENQLKRIQRFDLSLRSGVSLDRSVHVRYARLRTRETEEEVYAPILLLSSTIDLLDTPETTWVIIDVFEAVRTLAAVEGLSWENGKHEVQFIKVWGWAPKDKMKKRKPRTNSKTQPTLRRYQEEAIMRVLNERRVVVDIIGPLLGGWYLPLKPRQALSGSRFRT